MVLFEVFMTGWARPPFPDLAGDVIRGQSGDREKGTRPWRWLPGRGY